MPRPTSRPAVAVVGSVNPDREYHPPLRGDAAKAKEACHEIGAALLRAGCDLVPFSPKPHYVEGMVAAGYLAAAGPDQPGRIVARVARHQEFDLPLAPDSPVELRIHRDTSGEWEVSYYRGLLNADGVVLIGGGQSTRIAGILAITHGIPVLPVAAFGAGAGQVWVNLDHNRDDDLTDDDIALLGAPWSKDSATSLVENLTRRIASRARHRERQRQTQRRQARNAMLGRLVSAAALVLAVSAIVVAGAPAAARPWTLALLLGAPCSRRSPGR